MKIYKFRNCYLNTLERRVVRDGKFLELTPRTFDVLQMLVENCGEIVTKDEILGKVWGGSFVEEGNLPVHISKLRRLLDESKTERFIETVQGTGYRFVSPVQTTGEDEWQKHVSGNGHSRLSETARDLALGSIAVLPLQNESDNPEIDYLADGLTESLINSLSQISNLRVIARNTVFRYKNKDADAIEVGETLGVSAVLTGRIRAVKDNLVISAELVNVSDGAQLWGDQFDQPFSGIIEVQGKIISAVSDKLRPEASNDAWDSAMQPITEHPQSYRFYLKGKYLLSKRVVDSVYKAIEYFDRSLSIDPGNVHSYIEIAQCYRFLYSVDHISHKDFQIKVTPILTIALSMNQSIDELEVMIADLKRDLEWDFKESERHFQRAMALNPQCLNALIRYSELLMFLRRFSEAMEWLDEVMRLDPFSLSTYKRIGRLFFFAGKYEKAIAYLEDALEMEPADYETLALFGAVLTELGEYDKALNALHRSLNAQYNSDVLSMVGCIRAIEGRKGKAKEILEELASRSTYQYRNSVNFARIYLALGEKEIAYDYLDRSIERRESDLVGLNVDPRWGSLRNEERFKRLVSLIGLTSTKIKVV